jgi:hypothetical protein
MFTHELLIPLIHRVSLITISGHYTSESVDKYYVNGVVVRGIPPNDGYVQCFLGNELAWSRPVFRSLDNYRSEYPFLIHPGCVIKVNVEAGLDCTLEYTVAVLCGYRVKHIND